MNPLTIEELRELERPRAGLVAEDEDNPIFDNVLRAIRELIACKESMEQEQQGMPWRQLHKNGLVKMDKLEARHDRLRKAAEAVLKRVHRGSIEALRAALEGK